MVASCSVHLVAFSEPAPLVFDVNTVQEGVIRMIPGITVTEVTKCLAERDKSPFSGVDDFKRRSGLSASCISGMTF